LSADDPVAICIVCHQPLRNVELHYRLAEGDTYLRFPPSEARARVIEGHSAFHQAIAGVVDRVGDLADATANGRVGVSGDSLAHGACPTPIALPRGPEDGPIDQAHELSTCSCLTCAVAGVGKSPTTYSVLNPRPEEQPVPTVEQVAYVVFCVARVLLLGLGALVTVAVSATFVH
jgi:hypothetical protein